MIDVCPKVECGLRIEALCILGIGCHVPNSLCYGFTVYPDLRVRSEEIIAKRRNFSKWQSLDVCPFSSSATLRFTTST